VALNTVTDATFPNMDGSKSMEMLPVAISAGDATETLNCADPPGGAASVET